jgi:hypothetical protein
VHVTFAHAYHLIFLCLGFFLFWFEETWNVFYFLFYFIYLFLFVGVCFIITWVHLVLHGLLHLFFLLPCHFLAFFFLKGIFLVFF